jgi:hypothetical protein
MFDICVLALAIVLLTMATNRTWDIKIGKHRPVSASGNYKLGLIFPLGAVISILAIIRIVGHFDSGLCVSCSRIPYSLVVTPYVGWVLTFIGLFGLKSFTEIRKPMSRALVIIAIICGPLLLGVGFFQILLRLRA